MRETEATTKAVENVLSAVYNDIVQSMHEAIHGKVHEQLDGEQLIAFTNLLNQKLTDEDLDDLLKDPCVLEIKIHADIVNGKIIGNKSVRFYFK